MKFLFSALLGISLLSFSSCKKIEDSLNLSADVSITPKSLEFTIPTTTNTDSVSTLKEIEVKLNVDSLIKSKDANYSKSNVKSIKVKEFKLELTNADNANNLGNFASLFSNLSANGKTAIVIVSKDPNPDTNISSLNLPVNETIDIIDYVNSDTFKFILRGKLRRATTKPLTAKITVNYNFGVGK